MRIERVYAQALGPFVDQALDLAPGMTVIYGPNESGKSSWHAALYLAICGMRRTRGRGTTEEDQLRALHKPWDGHKWEVGAIIRLEDGRRIELHHDLLGRVDCWAREIDRGRDVSNEIVNGTPDASRWLGLDRKSFLATACIRQAHLLGILDAPGLLQEHLQRAAATAGTAATAAGAIARLEEFRREHIGADMAHSTKPLRQAKRWVETAEAALRQAQEAHERFSQLAALADRGRKRAEEGEHELRLLTAAIEAAEVERLRERYERAVELADRFQGEPPPGLTRDDEVAQQVATAVQGWEQRPAHIDLSGPTSEEIQRELDEVPAIPPGDIEPHSDVVAAWEAFSRAEQALELLGEAPPEPTPPQTGGLSEGQLIELARDLEVSVPTVDPRLQERIREARERVNAKGPRMMALFATAALAVAAGVMLAVATVPIGGLILVAAGLGIAGWGLLARNRAQIKALRELRDAEAALGKEGYRFEQVTARRKAALERVDSVGLHPDPASLRDYVAKMASAREAKERLEQWEGRRAAVEQEAMTGRRKLETALREREALLGSDPRSSFASYVDLCRERARTAAEAAKRPQIEARLHAQRDLEQAAADAGRRRAQANEAILLAAKAVGATGDDEGALVAGLRAWQVRRAEEIQRTEEAVREWTELEGLLEGKSLSQLGTEVGQRAELAQNVAHGFDPAELASVQLEPDAHRQRERLREEVNRVRREAERLAGNVETEVARIPSVAEAEEELSAAKSEFERVKRLDYTLKKTLDFLQAAQDRVHNDIAPVLASTIREWLPTLTSGRYVSASVDPASLAVTVTTSAGLWRDAAYLSQGTREQIYLLLRVALAKHLARPGEVIPLILDDVTAQCDMERTTKLLGILKAVSQERQVILFTQDNDALAWAEANLEEPVDRLSRLDPATVPA